MIKLTLQVLTGVVLLIVAIVATVRLIRNPRDLPLRVLAPGLICLSLAASLGIRHVTQELFHAALGSWSSRVVDVQWMTMAYCFGTFFLLIEQRRTARRTKATAASEFILYLACASCVIWVETVGKAAGKIHNPSQIADYQNLYMAADHLSWDGACLYFSAVGIVRAIRYGRSLNHRWAKRSLWLVMSGAATMALGVDAVDLLIYVLHAVQGDSGPKHYYLLGLIYLTGLLAGQALLALGFVLPALAEMTTKLIACRDHIVLRRRHRRTAYLWNLLTTTFPQVILSPLAVTAAVSTTNLLERDASEIADGLALLAPYYLAGGLAFESHSNGIDNPKLAAYVVHSSLHVLQHERQHNRDEQLSRSDPPYPRLMPDFADLRSMDRWLEGLSRSLQNMTEVHGRVAGGLLAR